METFQRISRLSLAFRFNTRRRPVIRPPAAFSTKEKRADMVPSPRWGEGQGEGRIHTISLLKATKQIIKLERISGGSVIVVRLPGQAGVDRLQGQLG